MRNYIFVDGSYYCFYRYYALHQWWKNAYPDTPLEGPLIDNVLFKEKFCKTFVDNLRDIPKRLGLAKEEEVKVYVGKDCPRADIWRVGLFPEYKANRVQDDTFMGGPFFKMAYEDDLFLHGGAQGILSHPHLEADDCIALATRHLLLTLEDCQVYIITSDRDYLQLKCPRVHLFTCAFKNLADSKGAFGDGTKDLRLKIIMGDKSDNIPSVFPKCGIVTATKCVEDEALFQKKMGDNPVYLEQLALNEQLVSFERIPMELQSEFYASFETL